jgi:hypothetical protein
MTKSRSSRCNRVERFEREIDATNATLAPLDFCPAGLDPPRTHRDAPSAS